MKRLITTAVLAISALGAIAQGTITFNNGATTVVNWGTINVPAGLAGTAIAGDQGVHVGLYYNTTGTTFALVSPIPYLGTLSSGTTNAAVNGRWNSGTITVQGLVAGATGNFQVRAWSGNFATYELATAGKALYTGTTATFPNPSGGAIDAGTGIPGAAAALSGFPSGMVVNGAVPEPSTIALAALGLGALVLVRRRK